MSRLSGPVDNPRYLLVRNWRAFNMERKDNHALTMRPGARKEDAQVFLRPWRHCVARWQ